MPRAKGSKKGIITVTQKEADARWYSSHKETAIARAKKYYDNNKQKVSEYKKQWYLKRKQQLDTEIIDSPEQWVKKYV